MSAARPEVWIVDDSRLETERLTGLLRASYSVTSFVEGATALEALTSAPTRPAIVIVDWELPGFSGVELCRFLRERHDAVSLPVLMLTSHDAEEDVAEALAAGANDFVSKPYNAVELLARVATLVSVSRLGRASRESGAWLAAVLGSIGDAVIATDAEARVTFMNPIAEQLTRWSEADAKGQPIGAPFRILKEESREPQVNPVLQALREGKIAQLANHTVLVARDGSERIIDDSAAPIRDTNGAIVGAVVVFRDVTERSRAERARRQRTRELELGAIVSSALADATPVRDQLQRCAEAVRVNLDAALVRIWTLGMGGDELVMQASAGLYTHLDGPHGRVPVGALKIGRIAGNRAALVTNDVAHDPHVGDRAWAAREQLVAFAGYPLIVNDRVVGVVALFSRNVLDDHAIRSLESVAAQLSVGIARSELEREREGMLKDSETQRKLLAELFAQAPVAIAVLAGPQHVVEVANPRVLAMWGREHEEVLGWPLFDALPEVREQGLEARLDGVRTTGRPFGGRELLVKVRRGPERSLQDAYFDLVYQPLQGPDGPSDKVLVIANDVTESVLVRRRVDELAATIREREERLRLAVDATGVGIWEIDLGTRAIYGDRGMRHIFGLTDDEPLSIDRGFLRMAQNDQERVRAALRGAVERGGSRIHETFQTMRPLDGAQRSVEIRGQAVVGDTGASRLIGTVVDVTEQRQAEAVREELVSTQREALEVARRQHEFEQYLVGIVSHDLRSPMQAIIMATELLQRGGELAENGQRQATRIRDSASRATRMIRDVLDFTQARLAGGFQLNKEPVDLALVVRDAVEETKLGAQGRELRLTIAGDCRGQWDRDRTAQVVTNLLANAVKYSPADSAIDVVLRADESSAQLAVHNVGEPIAPSALSRIFSPMQRESTDQTTRSIGLGLFIVDSIVRSHGGHVSVESTSEKGTTFSVLLPKEAAARS